MGLTFFNQHFNVFQTIINCGYTTPTTRKLTKTNKNNSISNFVGIYRQKTPVGDTVSIYRRSKSVGIYRPYHRCIIQFFWKVATVWWRGFFQTILLMEWPRDLNRDLRTVTWHGHQWTHRRNVSIGDSIGNSQYIPTLPTLYFSFFFPIPPLPSQAAANHPS